MNVPPASIIVPTLNEEKYLPLLLESLLCLESEVEVIVVDGNSKDGTERVVREYESRFKQGSSLRFVKSDVRSIAAQRNLGASLARHETLVFSDADALVPSETYGMLLSSFERYGYAVAAPRIVPIEPGFILKFFQHWFFVTQLTLFAFGRPFFGGGFVITRRSVFEKVGGFNPEIVLGEDVDYSLKASKLGRSRLFFTPLPISSRRLIKYGYWWMFRETPNILRLIFTGRVIPDTLYYPFGGYGGQKEHHVTKRTEL